MSKTYSLDGLNQTEIMHGHWFIY